MKKLIICSLLAVSPLLANAQFVTPEDMQNLIAKEILIKGCNEVGALGYQIVLAKNRGKSEQYLLESLQKIDDNDPNVSQVLETVHLNVVKLIFAKKINSPHKGQWEATQYCREAIPAMVGGD
jgi:hypothetical protein